MPASRALLDTSVLVAALHRDDRHFEPCVEALDGFRGVLLTTEAVLTESMFLLANVEGGPRTCLDFFVRGGAILVPSDAESLRRCQFLVEKYNDLPMDFADATLVALAERAGTGLVFTLDRHDFGTYRFGRKKSFVIRP